MIKRTCRAIALAGAAAAVAPAAAQTLPTIKLSGDVRIRLEDDWNSHLATGTLRPDRGRARVRARLGASADLGDGFTLAARIRTGGENSQQNANITFADFNGNPVDKLKITGERLSLAWKDRHAGAEVGKMGFPFFTNNEYFWDADIAPLGGAANLSLPLGRSARLKLIGGGFALPVGLAHYSGNLYAGQAVATGGPATLAVGVFRFEADRTNPNRLILLDNNGSRDYTVLAINGQYKVKAAGMPLAFTADLYRNLVDYATYPDAISRTYARERTGYVLGAAWGDVAAPHHVQLGYRFFHMERFAVDSSYSHDDVARLGTASQALLTDLRGHDLYVNYAFAKHWTIGARTMFTRRITSPEDDKRARVDLTYAF